MLADWGLFCSVLTAPPGLAWLLNSLFAPQYLTHRSVNVEANTWTQILMRFSHPKQMTHKDIAACEDKWMKNGCLPGFAFSNCKIFTLVVLECCGPFVLTQRLTPADEFFRNDRICPVTASVRALEVRCGATWMLGFERGGKGNDASMWKCLWNVCLSDAVDTESAAVDQVLSPLNTSAGLKHLVA